MKVLILKDKYAGAYDSFPVFFENLLSAFKKCGIEAILSDKIENIIKIIEKNDIDFTINIGQYNFFSNGIELYKKYPIINYQWIIDNPLRYPNVDFKSSRNRLINIDKSFELFEGKIRTDYLNLPLVFPEVETIDENRINAVFAPIKIKSLNEFELKIYRSSNRTIIEDLINDYNFDDSLSEKIAIMFQLHPEIENKFEIFEIINGYFRVRKRIKLISSIKKHPVIVASQKPCELKFEDNISFMDPLNYAEIQQYQKKYTFLLNCNPNYDLCLHDRVSYGIAKGSIIISDKNILLNKLNMPLCVCYSEVKKLDELLDYAILNRSDILRKQRSCIEQYKYQKIVDIIIDNYRNGGKYDKK